MLTLAMLFFGLYALLTGEIPIGKRAIYFIEAKHARIIGAICMSPFPLTIVLLLGVWVLMAASGMAVSLDKLFWIGIGIELSAVIGCAAVAGVVSRVYRKPIVETFAVLPGIAHQESRTMSAHQEGSPAIINLLSNSQSLSGSASPLVVVCSFFCAAAGYSISLMNRIPPWSERRLRKIRDSRRTWGKYGKLRLISARVWPAGEAWMSLTWKAQNGVAVLLSSATDGAAAKFSGFVSSFHRARS